MQEKKQKNESLKKDKLSLKVVSNDNPYLSSDIQQKLLQPRRLASYFIVLIDSGSITYNLDLQDITLTDGHLLFAMPNQVFVPPPKPAPVAPYILLKVLFGVLEHQVHRGILNGQGSGMGQRLKQHQRILRVVPFNSAE